MDPLSKVLDSDGMVRSDAALLALMAAAGDRK
jgi:hypothetical protein